MKKKSKTGFDFDVTKLLYRLRFTHAGERLTVYGRTQKECEEKKIRKIKEYEENLLHIENKNITLTQCYDSFLAEKEKQVKAATIYHYGKYWKYIVKPLGKAKICNLKPLHIQTLQKQMKQKGYSADVINRTIAVLSQILDHGLYFLEAITRNPCKAVGKLKTETSKPKMTETSHRALNKEEQELFFDHVRGSHYRNLYYFLLYTGCRVGEATALNWFDIDFTNNTIRISKTTSRTSNTEYIISESPKNSSSDRTVLMNEKLKAILEEQRQNVKMLFGNSNTLVFPNTKGTIATENTINCCIAKAIKTINAQSEKHIEHFSVHAFRDTFATHCAENGFTPQEIQACLGHATLNMTMNVYIQPRNEVMKEKIKNLSFAV